MSLRRDPRRRAAVLTVLLVAAGGALVQRLSPTGGGGDDATVTDATVPDAARAVAGTRAEDDGGVRELFGRAVASLQARRHADAARVLEEILRRAPHLPEAHVNMGFAQLGLGEHARAARFFESAIDLRPAQANAYFGLAEALEVTGDLRGARGAMRAYVHLSAADDPYLPRARAAIWEWSARLGDPLDIP